MKFLENTFMAIGMVLVSTSAWKIISAGEYTPINLFILGFISIIMGQSAKAILDSRARDRYNLLNGKKS